MQDGKRDIYNGLKSLMFSVQITLQVTFATEFHVRQENYSALEGMKTFKRLDFM